MGNYRRKDYEREHLTLNETIWWALASLMTLIFAIVCWAGCYSIFNFPEAPRNFQILKRLGRIGEITAFTPLDAPATRSVSPENLYELFYSLGDSKIEEFNQMLKRGYITNYRKIPVFRYLQGEFRILEVRQLTSQDFISPGILIKARAYAKADDNEMSSPYPLVIDYVLPTQSDSSIDNFQAGDQFMIKKSLHCASIVNVQKIGRAGDPTLRCVVVPLAYNVYISPDKHEIPLHPPDDINVIASFPIFEGGLPQESER